MFKAIILAIAIAANPTWFQERSLAKIQYNVVDEDGEKHTHTCTGFMVNAAKGYLLTAEHCVPKDGEQVVFVDGIVSEVVKKDANFALIQVEPFSRPILDIGKDVDISEHVLVLGYGYGDLHRFDRHVSSIDIADIEEKVHVTCGIIALDGPLAPGMSGGPILNHANKVVGLNQASSAVIGLGCNVKSINKFLKDVK